MVALRRLLPLACAIVFVDTLFFAALTPLLPTLRRAYGLSKADAGMLTGAYAVGVLVAAVPGGVLAARLGVKPTALAGVGLTAVGTLAFGLAGQLGWLMAARLGGGVGSALSWAAAVTWVTEAAPRARRGELMGLTLGAAVAGALVGPLLGTLAAAVGTATAFGAVAAAGVALAGWVAATPGLPPVALPTASRLLGGPARSTLLTGLGLVLLSPLLFSVLSVLVPLELARLGWGPGAIGGLYLLTAGVEAIAHPLIGRWSDRAGALAPTRVGLGAAVPVLLALAAFGDPRALAAMVLLAGLAFGMTLVPGMALTTRAGDAAGLGTALSFGLVNLAWALGYAVGAPASGALAQTAGDAVSYLALAALCAVAWLVLPRLAAPAGALPGGPGHPE